MVVIQRALTPKPSFFELGVLAHAVTLFILHIFLDNADVLVLKDIRDLLRVLLCLLNSVFHRLDVLMVQGSPIYWALHWSFG